MSEAVSKVGDKWGKIHSGSRPRKWDQLKLVHADVARRICGNPEISIIQAVEERLRRVGKQFGAAVSIGCGMGKPEINLVASGLVEHFDFFELSEKSCEIGYDYARKHGVADRVTFQIGDAFSLIEHKPNYDLVYWKHALHHMPDVVEAVAFSKAILNDDGYFSALEYCGPNLFQYDDEFLAVARRVYDTIPVRLKGNPKAPLRPDGQAPKIRQINLIDPIALQEDDPSESVDSERILAGIKEHFPHADIRNTGGMLSHSILHRIANNFDETQMTNRKILYEVLDAEVPLMEKGVCHFCYALAEKR